MAHNLASINGLTTMAYQGATPWHKLGQRMSESANVHEALRVGGLYWQVQTRDLFLADGRKIDDARAVVRDVDSAILGSVGPKFTPIQNEQAFEVLSDACREHGVTIATVGALGNGAKTWMLAKLPETVQPVPGDSVNGYFLIVNAHDGSTAYGARPTPIRVVCQNTLNAALGEGVDMIRIRHTKTAQTRVDEAKRLIDRMLLAMRKTGETFAQLAEKRLNPAEAAAYIDSIFPMPKEDPNNSTIRDRRQSIMRLTWHGKGAQLAGSDANGTTLWAAYNAIAEYFDHVRPAEAKSAAGLQNANESAIFGNNAATKLAALRAARKLVAA